MFLGRVSGRRQELRRGGQTEQLLGGDEQVGDGLFYLRELLLGLHHGFAG